MPHHVQIDPSSVMHAEWKLPLAPFLQDPAAACTTRAPKNSIPPTRSGARRCSRAFSPRAPSSPLPHVHRSPSCVTASVWSCAHVSRVSAQRHEGATTREQIRSRSSYADICGLLQAPQAAITEHAQCGPEVASSCYAPTLLACLPPPGAAPSPPSEGSVRPPSRRPLSPSQLPESNQTKTCSLMRATSGSLHKGLSPRRGATHHHDHDCDDDHRALPLGLIRALPLGVRTQQQGRSRVLRSACQQRRQQLR